MDIPSAIASFKTMADLTALVIKLSTDSKVTEKAIELQTALLSLQSDMFNLTAQNQGLLREKGELEQRLIDAENWEAESQNYELTEVGNKIFVYASKADQETTTPAHWLCANCYNNKQKSILQRGTNSMKGWSWICFRCPQPLYFNG